jgi:RecB family exonuclease
VKSYAREKMELLDRLGYASSKAEDGEREPRSRLGWGEVPSSAPAYDPLPRG